MPETVAMIGINSGESGARWYALMYFGIGIVMCYPAEFLTEVGDRMGWLVSWKKVIWLEVGLIGTIVLTMIFLKRSYPEIPWFYPLAVIAFTALLARGVPWLIVQLFGSDDDD